MDDYQEMYLKLFNKVTDVIEELQQIQRQTEEMYLQSKDRDIYLLEHNTNKKKSQPTKCNGKTN